MRVRSVREVLALLVACSVMTGCPAVSLPPSVILVTLDTTRPDRLGCYGHQGARSPNLDHFAGGATLFENAYATSSWTLPSHASLFTGLLPMQHGAQSVPEAPNKSLGYGVRPLAESFTTLAEVLRQAGYRTGAVVAGPALRAELGVAQGFETYEDTIPKLHGKRAEQVADEAIALIEAFGSERYFLFVNFFDPHAPYRPPPPFDRGLRGRDADQAQPLKNKLLKTLIERLSADSVARPVAELPPDIRGALAAMLAGYDAEIAYMDHHLGRLLDAVAAAPGGDRTMIVVTGDHGESFGEHYFVSHGAHLYEHNVRVPLIVRRPGGTKGARVTTPVSNHRVFAEILDTIGLEVPAAVDPGPLSRKDVVVLQVQRSESNMRLFGEFFARDLRAIIDPPHKLIESTSEPPAVYDVVRDPGELHNLAASKPELVTALIERLKAVTDAHPPQFVAEARATLSPETEEALRALGYLD